MSLLDWLIIVCYAGGLIILGWRLGLRQKSSEDYYLAGDEIIQSFYTIMGDFLYRICLFCRRYFRHCDRINKQDRVRLLRSCFRSISCGYNLFKSQAHGSHSRTHNGSCSKPYSLAICSFSLLALVECHRISPDNICDLHGKPFLSTDP